MKEVESDQAARYIKSRIINKVISFVQQCFVLKGMLQSLRLKYHVHTIDIEPSLSNNAIYEHKCLKNIKHLYKQAGRCDETATIQRYY